MKNLLSLNQFDKMELVNTLEIATQMRRIVQAAYKKGPQLLGKNIAIISSKASLHLNAFVLASHYLSGNPLTFFDSLDVSEFAKSLDNMGISSIVISNPNDNLIFNLAKNVNCTLINGGSTQHNPVAVLADLLTLSHKLDSLNNLTVLAVGNRDTNKINDLMHCLGLFGSNLTWFLPNEDVVTARRGIILDKIESAFSGADAVIDLGLSEYSQGDKYYGSNGGILERLIDKARIDAPLLGSRVVVDNVGIKEYPHSAVNLQQTNLVAAAMAVMYISHKM